MPEHRVLMLVGAPAEYASSSSSFSTLKSPIFSLVSKILPELIQLIGVDDTRSLRRSYRNRRTILCAHRNVASLGFSIHIFRKNSSSAWRLTS